MRIGRIIILYVTCNFTFRGRSTNTNDLNYNLEVPSAPLCTVEKCDSHQCQRAIVQAPYCDPIITHNYEMPTLASKLKRANRSYFSRFSFRNIPFVVGTSVTPSHNLGLNIQEVCYFIRKWGTSIILSFLCSKGIKYNEIQTICCKWNYPPSYTEN